MTCKISPSKTLYTLLFFILFLNIGNFISIYLKLKFNYSDMKPIIRLFNFDTEQSIPSLFSFLILLFSALLLFQIYKASFHNSQLLKRWRVLSFIFLFLSFDEILSFHEGLNNFLNKIINETYHNWLWSIPYGLLVFVIFIYFIPMIKIIPKQINFLLFTSASLFLFGAVGLEIFVNLNDIIVGDVFDKTYILFYSMEETLEMIGISLFIYTLLRYISSNEDNFLLVKMEV